MKTIWQTRAPYSDRMPAGITLLICIVLSCSACIARQPAPLALISLADMLLLFGLSGQPLHDLKRQVKYLFFQSVIIIPLYFLRYSYDGILPGVIISWQIFLAFLPGYILMTCINQSKIIKALSRVMPVRTAFVLSVSLNFIPLLIREIQSIYEVQVMRGARILPRDLLRPWHWPDLIHCLMIPAIVRTLAISRDVALAAKVRNFGENDRRTFWTGE